MKEGDDDGDKYHRCTFRSLLRPDPEDWMTEWPTNQNVWRMDLYWQNSVTDQDHNNYKQQQQHQQNDQQEKDEPITFHMNNEMYLGETWDYSAGSDRGNGKRTSTTTRSSTTTKHPYPPFVNATLKTRAVMWGTEAHENWYLLEYNPDWETMMVYYCAHTAAVDRFDSIAMVLKKKGPTIDSESGQNNLNVDDDDDDPRPCTSSAHQYGPTEEQHEYYQQLAHELLGSEHGNLQRIEPSCDC